jgi:ribosome-binding protein aMBF1 (putative translation factor)
MRSICTLRQIVLKDKPPYNEFMTRDKPTSLSLRLGAKIAKLRRYKGFTQGYVEESTGLPAGYLSRIEHGAILPGLEVLAAIAKVLEISLPRLVSGIVEDEE